MPDHRFTPLPVPASDLGESPFWHPDERALYWCDIAGRAVTGARLACPMWQKTVYGALS